MSRYQYNEAATVPAINAELEKIQEAIEDSLSRSGDTPNTMTAPLDMNGERIMNLPEAVSDSEPMRKGEAQPFVDAAAASATAALASEQAAAASASSASASASSSSADAAVAEQLVDELNSLYLGAFNSNPATDNEGNPLVKGVLYYNNVLNEIYVFNGISWVIAASQQTATDAASSAFQAANSAAAALASQNAASTSASQASTSASSASTSSTQASGFAASASDSATAAQTSATNASGSATDAAASAAAALNSANAASDSEDAAALSETNAAGSATAAASSATSASNSASAANTSATNAAGSATAAATSATNAAGSATSASASATSAGTSAGEALQYLTETEAARDEVLQYSTAVSKGLVFIGLYDASTGVYPTLPVDIVGNPFWIISTGGTVSGTVLNPGDSLIYDVTNESFIKLDTVDQVVSVAGKTGAVSLDKADVGLANVDNTSDLNKPISTATQTALDLKVDDSQLATAATANSVAQRTSDGSLNVVGLGATSDITLAAGGKIKFNDDRYFSPENNVDGAEISANGVFKVKTGATPTERLRIDSLGNVGIGTSSPSAKIEVFGGSLSSTAGNSIENFVLRNTSTNQDRLRFFERRVSNGSDWQSSAWRIQRKIDSVDMAFVEFDEAELAFGTGIGSTEKLRITSSGNVGIGTSSPTSKLHINEASTSGTNVSLFEIDTASGGAFNIICSDLSSAGPNWAIRTGNNEPLTFVQSSTERMRIDSSGNVLVGTTTAGAPIAATTGGSFSYRVGNELSISRQGTGASAPVAILNQTGNDGQVLEFRKDGSTVGSIGNTGTQMYIGTPSQSGVVFANNHIYPAESGNVNDNDINLGISSSRFKDLYLSGGVYLGGTGAANYLDDYEEGTWTPTFVSGVSGATYVTTEGRYTKIGRMVYVNFRISTSAGTATGVRIGIGELPFASAIGVQIGGSGSVAYFDADVIGSTTTNVPTLYVGANSTTIFLYKSNGTDFLGTDLANAASVTFYATVVYEAA